MPALLSAADTVYPHVADGVEIIDLTGIVDGSDAGSDIEDRVLDAALVLVARWGVAKTSLADVAREAGCSRATVYRAFPGGKPAVFRRLGLRELAAYVASII